MHNKAMDAVQQLLLPSHPSMVTLDPLGICSCNDSGIPVWNVLSSLLTRHPCTVDQLLSLLTDVAATVGNEAPGNYANVRAVLQDSQLATLFFPEGVTALLHAARMLPELFGAEGHSLQALQTGICSQLNVTRQQVACLLAHMFLGTLRRPAWQKWWADFGVWQHTSSSSSSSMQQTQAMQYTDVPTGPLQTVLDSPAKVYLHILLSYFCHLGQLSANSCCWQQHITVARVHQLPSTTQPGSTSTSNSSSSSSSSNDNSPDRPTMHSQHAKSAASIRCWQQQEGAPTSEGSSTAWTAAAAAPAAVAAVDWAASAVLLQPLKLNSREMWQVSDQQQMAQLLGVGDSAQVVFSNKYVGFGMSGTQEEQVFGCSPELCVLMLCCPSLLDNEVLLVQGPAMYGQTSGFGRHTTLVQQPLALQMGLNWQSKRLVFMDALEMDRWTALLSQQQQAATTDAARIPASLASQGVSPLPFIPDLLKAHSRRELGKAFCAFSAAAASGCSCVSSGHWGCGAFGGHREVKALLQAMAAAQAGITLIFSDLGGSSRIDSIAAGTKSGPAANSSTAGVAYGECGSAMKCCAGGSAEGPAAGLSAAFSSMSVQAEASHSADEPGEAAAVPEAVQSPSAASAAPKVASAAADILDSKQRLGPEGGTRSTAATFGSQLSQLLVQLQDAGVTVGQLYKVLVKLGQGMMRGECDATKFSQGCAVFHAVAKMLLQGRADDEAV